MELNANTGALGILRTFVAGMNKEIDQVEAHAEKAQAKVWKAITGGEGGGNGSSSGAMVWKASPAKAMQEIRKESEKAERASRGAKSNWNSVYQMMNTHSPHGAIRNVMSGNVNGGTFQSVGHLMTKLGLQKSGEGLGEAAMRIGGFAGVVGILAHHLSNQLQEREQQREETYGIANSVAGIELKRTMANRMKTSGIADQVRFRQQMSAMESQRDATASSWLFDSEDSRLRSQRNIERFAKNYETKKGLAKVFDSKALQGTTKAEWINSPAVTGMVKKENPVLSYFHDLDPTGFADDAYQLAKDEAAGKIADKALKALQQRLDDRVNSYRSDPANAVMFHRLEEKLEMIEEWEVERHQQWNPY